MRTTIKLLAAVAALTLIPGGRAPAVTKAEKAQGEQSVEARILETIAAARRQKASPCPAWINELPKKRQRHNVDLLVKQLERRKTTGEPWGYVDDEVMTTALLSGVISYYGSLDKAPGFSPQTRQELIKFFQSWQDPKSGRFHTWKQPDRLCNEKYVVGLLGMLGAKPLYPWTTNEQAAEKKQEKPKLDTTVFLQRSASDPNWEAGGWGVGSHTGAMACEIFRAINTGETELAADLEKGIANILSHQCPADGLWGPPEAAIGVRIGGTLKVIGRLGFYLGMEIPHTKELADALIEHQKSGDWKEAAKLQGDCVPRNAIEMVAFCLEASDYRRDELHETMEGMAMDMRMFDTPDRRRGTIEYAYGMAADYLHWTGCVLTNATRGFNRGLSYEYKLVLQPDGKTVKVVKKEPGERFY